jgi:hypothetical protein
LINAATACTGPLEPSGDFLCCEETIVQ